MTDRDQPAQLIYTTSTAATRCEHDGCAYLTHHGHCPEHLEDER